MRLKGSVVPKGSEFKALKKTWCWLMQVIRFPPSWCHCYNSSITVFCGWIHTASCLSSHVDGE